MTMVGTLLADQSPESILASTNLIRSPWWSPGCSGWKRSSPTTSELPWWLPATGDGEDQVQLHPNTHGGHLYAEDGEDEAQLPPDLPDSSPKICRMLASISMLTISSVATAHIFIADF